MGLVKKKRKKPGQRKTAFWVTLALLIGVFLAAWWIWPGLYKASPRLNFILLEKNGDFIKLLNGEALRLHPQDRIKIAGISTSITFNVGVRLTAAGLDIEALIHEELPIASLIPPEARYRSNIYRAFVKQNNRELGYVDLVVEPFVEDWLDRAARAIDPALRLSVLEEALAFAPEEEQIRERLLQEYKTQKKWAKAASLLEEALRRKADERRLIELLTVYETMADSEGVISVIQRLIKENPEDAGLRLRLAEVLEKAGKLREAIKEYEASLDLVEEKLPLYKILGYLHTQTNAPRKAIEAYLKAVELNGKDVNLYYNLATLYEGIGEKEKAAQYLLQAVSLKPDDLKNRLDLAEALLEKGRIVEAEKLLKEVLDKDPKSVKALLLMITLLDKQGDKKKLRDAYEKLLVLDPGNETIIFNLGVLEYESGQWTKSISYFESYLKSRPDDLDVHGFLFDLYKKAKLDDQAFRTAKALIMLKPDDPAPYFFVFEYAHSRGDYQSVLPLLEKGVKARPGDIDLRGFFVLALLKTGKEDLAMEHLEAMAREKPKDVDILLQLATLQEKQDKSEAALENYEKILALSPNHKEAGQGRISLLLQKARIEERQGRSKEAMGLYRKILDSAPGHEEAAEAYLRLRIRVLQ
jgi:tetratricopeptide (TPR) repeat protein